MSFEDVKVGDTVLIRVTYRRGFSLGRSFYVRKPVERVTPKRFVVCGNQYTKADGLLFGGYGVAHKLGEVEDQTKEAQEYKLILSASDALYELNRSGMSEKLSLEDALTIIEIANKHK